MATLVLKPNPKRRLLFLFHLLAHFSNLCGLYAIPSSVATSTLWINNYTYSRWVYSDTIYVNPILAVSVDGYLDFGFGFLKNATSDTFYLAVIKIPKQNLTDYGFPPVILWCANRDRPVGTNATLEFTPNGDLVLTDRNGSVAWSSRKANNGATKMTLDNNGDLKLELSNGSIAWSFFQNPTDTWAARQTLLTPAWKILN